MLWHTRAVCAALRGSLRAAPWCHDERAFAYTYCIMCNYNGMFTRVFLIVEEGHHIECITTSVRHYNKCQGAGTGSYKYDIQNTRARKEKSGAYNAAVENILCNTIKSSIILIHRPTCPAITRRSVSLPARAPF